MPERGEELIISRYLRSLEGSAPDPAAMAFYAALDSVRSVDEATAGDIVRELADQRTHLKLIASENFSSLAVQQAMGNLLTDKYAEVFPATVSTPAVTMSTR
jgi:glycine hydroxymethyltransferase